MATKRNSDRKKNLKEDSKPEEVAEPIPEPKPEIDIVEIINQVKDKVVSELKPDMDKRLEQLNQQVSGIAQQLAKQIAEEIKDIRESLVQQPKPQPDMQQKVDVLSQSEIPEGQPQMQPQPDIQQPPNIQELLLRFAMDYLRPKPPQTNAQMFQTFEQASIRKNMADMSMDDYINRAVKQQVVKKILGSGFDETEYKKAEMTADHYMKPLRDVGVNAEKAQQIKHMQESEEKHEL